MINEAKINQEIRNSFLTNGYKVVSFIYIPEHEEQYTDDFTGDVFVEITNPEVRIKCIHENNMKIRRNDKKFIRVFGKISDMLYMQYNGTMLKMEY